jgi:adenine phosphoribosyltransferase
MPKHETYSVEIAGLKRELPLFEIKPGLKIAILNILGDTELVQACAKAETLSITTGQPQTLILDAKDIDLMKGKKVVIVDDVISTGSTLQGMRMILNKAGSTVVAETAIFTEGDRAQWMHIISLGHLPLFTD